MVALMQLQNPQEISPIAEALAQECARALLGGGKHGSAEEVTAGEDAVVGMALLLIGHDSAPLRSVAIATVRALDKDPRTGNGTLERLLDVLETGQPLRVAEDSEELEGYLGPQGFSGVAEVDEETSSVDVKLSMPSEAGSNALKERHAAADVNRTMQKVGSGVYMHDSTEGHSNTVRLSQVPSRSNLWNTSRPALTLVHN